jgi:hypothetical protein
MEVVVDLPWLEDDDEIDDQIPFQGRLEGHKWD